MVFLLVFGPLLAILTAGIVHIAYQVHMLFKDARWLVTELLSDYLARPVRVAHARLDSLGVVVLHRLEIADGPTFASGKVVVVPEVVVQYDPVALFLSKARAGAVRSVDVVRPEIRVVRTADGRFNIADLIRPRVRPVGPPFRGEVRIVGGKLSFTDHFTRGIHGSGRAVELRKICGIVSARDHPTVLFNISAVGESGKLGRIRVDGTLNTSTMFLRADVNVADADLAGLISFFGSASDRLRFSSGKLSAAVGLSVRLPLTAGATRVTGVARFANVAFSMFRRPAFVSGVDGVLLFAGNRVVVDGGGVIAKQRFTFSGILSGYGKDATARVVVRSPSMDINRVLGVWGARIRVDLASLEILSGIARRVGQARRLSWPQSWTPALKVTALGISAVYRKGEVVLDSVEFALNGAPVCGSGALDVSGRKRLQFHGSVRGLQVRSLGLPRSVISSGIIDAEFDVSRLNASPRFFVSLGARNVSSLGVHLDTLCADIDADVGSRRVSGLVVLNAYGGLVRARGIATSHKIDLAYSAEAVDVARLGIMLGRNDVSGRLYLVGRAFGKPSNPMLTGTAEIFDGSYADHMADYLRLAFSTDFKSLLVKEAVVARFPAEVHVSAFLSGIGSRAIKVEGKARLKHLETGQLSDLLQRELGVSGTIFGDFTFTSTYSLKPGLDENKPRPMDFSLKGHVQLDDGSAWGFLIDSAQAKLDLSNGRLAISDAALSSEGAQLSVSGGLDMNASELDMKFAIAGFDLSRLHHRIGDYLAVGGVANVSGSVSGRLDSFEVKAKVGFEDFTVNEVRFDKVALDTTYSRRGRISGRVKLTRGEQVFEVTSDGVDLETGFAESIAGHFSNVFVPDLRTILVASPYLASEKAERVREVVKRMPVLTGGRIDAEFELSGFLPTNRELSSHANTDVLEQLQGNAYLKGNNIEFDSRRMESLEINLALTGGEVRLDRAVAISGDTFALMSPIVHDGPVYKDGKLSLELSINNLELSNLRSWLGYSSLHGLATLDFMLEGEPRNPFVRGSLEVVEPGYESLRFSNLRAPQVRIDRGRIDVGEIILSKDGHQMVASGYVPWDWSSFSVPKSEHFEIVCSLKDEDLAILHTFAPLVEPSPATSGSLQAELRINGTTSDYKLSGRLKAEDGKVALRGFASIFTDVRAEVEFDGRTVVIRELSARSSSGGSVFVEPESSIAIANREQEYGQIDLSLRSNGLVIEEDGAFGLRENVRTQIDGNLVVSGTVLRPRVSCPSVAGLQEGITISNTLASFAIPKGKLPSFVSLPIRPVFDDVRIYLGESVRVKPPQMDLVIRGGGIIDGELGGKLLADVELLLEQGAIRLATSRLRIVPGARMVIRFRPPSEPEISITAFEAVTSVMAIGPLGRRERYTITVSANGPVSNLNIGFKSTPEGLSREQILAALGRVESLVGGGDFQQELSNVFKAMGTTALFAPVERFFTEELGFEEFTVEPGELSPLSVYVSRQLFGGFYASYYQRLRANLANVRDTEWMLRFGLRFKDFYSLSLSLDNEQTISGEITFSKAFGR
ncbi:MAG: translocation/assembly module TamB domain-containing protein [Armatimonadota bacterium]